MACQLEASDTQNVGSQRIRAVRMAQMYPGSRDHRGRRGRVPGGVRGWGLSADFQLQWGYKVIWVYSWGCHLYLVSTVIRTELLMETPRIRS